MTQSRVVSNIHTTKRGNPNKQRGRRVENKNILIDAAFDIMIDISKRKNIDLSEVLAKFKSDSEFSLEVMKQAKSLIESLKHKLSS